VKSFGTVDWYVYLITCKLVLPSCHHAPQTQVLRNLSN